jgi:hypothetical protein
MRCQRTTADAHNAEAWRVFDDLMDPQDRDPGRATAGRKVIVVRA